MRRMIINLLFSQHKNNRRLIDKMLADVTGNDTVHLIHLRTTFIQNTLSRLISLSKLYLLAGFKDIMKLYGFVDLQKTQLTMIQGS